MSARIFRDSVRPASGRSPKLVLCAGLKSSGSTWLYNAVIQICEASEGKKVTSGRVRPFYADRISDFPAGAERSKILVVKTHIPSPSLLFLTLFTRGTVFMTVREPRDAIASLMD